MQALHHYQKEGLLSSEIYDLKYFNVFQIIYSKKPAFEKIKRESYGSFQIV